METRGIKITQLPSITGILPIDSLLLMSDNSGLTKSLNTNSFYTTFSGAKNYLNIGSRLSIFNNHDTSNSTLYFNTLTATGSLSAGLQSNSINIILLDSGVTTQKIQNGAVTPTKQSGTLTSSVNLTAFTQTIIANSFAYINGLTVTVTPPTNTAKVLLGGYISIGCADAGLNIYRSIGGGAVSTVIPLSASASSNLSKIMMLDVGHGVANNANVIPISFLDSPNTTSSVTYSFGISAISVCNINRPVTAPGTAVISYSTSHINAVVLP
jgi:hypothetical protein